MDEYTKSNDEDQKLTDRNKELENEIQKLKDEKQELKDKIQKLNDEIGYAIESLDYHGFEECNKCCFWIKIDDLPKCNDIVQNVIKNFVINVFFIMMITREYVKIAV